MKMSKNERHNHEAMPDKGLCLPLFKPTPHFQKKKKRTTRKIPATACYLSPDFPESRIGGGGLGCESRPRHLHAYYHCMILTAWEANRIERASLVVIGSTVQ